MRLLAPAFLLLLLLAPPGSTQEAQDVGTTQTIELTNGDLITGEIIEVTASEVVVRHAEIDVVIRINRSLIKPPPPPVDEAAVKSPWSGSFDLSITGKRGNSQNQQTRVDFKARREDERTVDAYVITFEQARAETRDDNPAPPPAELKTTDFTARRVYAQARREWYLDETKWRPFLQGSIEDDKFKSFRQRYRIGAGGAYPWIENEKERWIGRVGAASVKEVGGDDESWEPEIILGMDYFLQIDEDRSISAGSDIYPSLEDKGEYQSISRAEYRMKVEADNPWTITVGAEHAENSDPDDGDSKTDLTYYFAAGFVF